MDEHPMLTPKDKLHNKDGKQIRLSGGACLIM